MTEPESEAESLSEDEGGEAEFRIYYQELLDVEIPSVKVKCKGCGKKFPFSKAVGVKMSDSQLVKNYYEHCLVNCPPYITSGLYSLDD